jgi:hypothetical protein
MNSRVGSKHLDFLLPLYIIVTPLLLLPLASHGTLGQILPSALHQQTKQEGVTQNPAASDALCIDHKQKTTDPLMDPKSLAHHILHAKQAFSDAFMRGWNNHTFSFRQRSIQ